MARQAETALQKRDRAQEKASTLQSKVQAFTERIKKLEDQIHHVTFKNKKLEVKLQEARLDATRAQTNPRNIVQMAMNASGLHEEPAPGGKSVGPLDHIFMGFQPPPLDFQPNPEIEQFATIQEQLDAHAAPAAQPPVVST